MKKYVLTDKTKEFNGVTLRRIRYLRDVPEAGIKKRDLGGWIEKEENLSHVGDACIYGDARVYGNAWVYGDAKVSGDAWVFGKAFVGGDAHVYGNAQISGDAHVYGNAQISGDAHVYGNAQVFGEAHVYDEAHICDNACVCGNAQVCGEAHVSGKAHVSGEACVRGEARVDSPTAIFTATNVGRENATLTVSKGADGIVVTRGCFTGSIEEFLDQSKKVHDEKIRREYERLIEVAQSRIHPHIIAD